MDVTYNTNQSWFTANMLENKYNLLFYWHFSRWEIICIHGVRDSLKEDSLLGEAVESVSHVGMLKKSITRVWKKNLHIDMETTESALGIYISQDAYRIARDL